MGGRGRWSGSGLLLAEAGREREEGRRAGRENAHLDIGGLEDTHARGARGEEIRGGDQGCDGKGHGGEEAEGVLDADERGVHGRQSVVGVAPSVAPRRQKESAGVTLSWAGNHTSSRWVAWIWTASRPMRRLLFLFRIRPDYTRPSMQQPGWRPRM